MNSVKNKIIEKLFSNPGKRIKDLVFWIFIAQIIVLIITGIILMYLSSDIDDPLFIIGILLAILSLAISWISNIVLYGFGELVENSKHISSDNNNHSKETV
jgi:cytochrome b subunit of formate dehydrogenase